jgi:hexosaminidase
LKIYAKNIGVCPKGHDGEGNAAWLFADEIIVD